MKYLARIFVDFFGLAVLAFGFVVGLLVLFGPGTTTIEDVNNGFKNLGSLFKSTIFSGDGSKEQYIAFAGVLLALIGILVFLGTFFTIFARSGKHEGWAIALYFIGVAVVILSLTGLFLTYGWSDSLHTIRVFFESIG